MKSMRIFVMLLVLGAACKNDRAEKRGGKPDTIYMEYTIGAEEGKDDVTCMFQFKPDRNSRRNLSLEESGGVQLDGEVLQPDSTAFNGVYYEVQKPLQSFTGEHTIVYTDLEGNKHTETFNFTPVSLKTELPQTVKRQDLSIQLEGVKPEDVMRVVLIDTAFYTTDINEVQSVKDGTLLISKKQLNAVVNGPVTLQLFKEEEHSLKDRSRKNGQISINYALSRDFELKD